MCHWINVSTRWERAVGDLRLLGWVVPLSVDSRMTASLDVFC